MLSRITALSNFIQTFIGERQTHLDHPAERELINPYCKKLANPYGTGIRPTIVRIIVVVISSVLSLVLSVEVVDVSLGGGGAATPGESIIPAKAEVASAAVRIVTAHVRRSLFTVLYLQKNTKIFV
jgi:hypothetical protein